MPPSNRLYKPRLVKFPIVRDGGIACVIESLPSRICEAKYNNLSTIARIEAIIGERRKFRKGAIEHEESRGSDALILIEPKRGIPPASQRNW